MYRYTFTHSVFTTYITYPKNLCTPKVNIFEKDQQNLHPKSKIRHGFHLQNKFATPQYIWSGVSNIVFKDDSRPEFWAWDVCM